MYRVIASISNDEQVLYFRPLVAHFLLLARGGQEGIVYLSFFFRVFREIRAKKYGEGTISVTG